MIALGCAVRLADTAGQEYSTSNCPEGAMSCICRGLGDAGRDVDVCK